MSAARSQLGDELIGLREAIYEAELAGASDDVVGQWLDALRRIGESLQGEAWTGLAGLRDLIVDLEAVHQSPMEFDGLVAGAYAERFAQWVQRFLDDGPSAAAPAAAVPAPDSAAEDIRRHTADLRTFFVSAQTAEPETALRAEARATLQRLIDETASRGRRGASDALRALLDDVDTVENSPVSLDGLVAESLAERFEAIAAELDDPDRGDAAPAADLPALLDQASMAMMLLEAGADPAHLGEAVDRVDALHAALVNQAPGDVLAIALGLKAHLATRVAGGAPVAPWEIAAIQDILDAVRLGVEAARDGRRAGINVGALLDALGGEPRAPAAGVGTAAEAGSGGLLQVVQTVENPKMLLAFIEDVRNELDTLEGATLTWEAQPDDPELLRSIFRSVHTVKGDAGLIGYPLLNRVFHSLENILSRLREREIGFRPAFAQLVLESTDLLRKLVVDLETALALESLDGWTPAVRDADLQGLLEAIEQANALEAEGRARPLGAALVAEGVTSAQAEEEALEEQRRPLGRVLVDEGVVSDDQVARALEQQQAARRAPGIQETIKVNLERLDTLIDLVGELSIAQTMLVTQQRRLVLKSGRRTDTAFDKLLERFGKLTQDIQDRAMAMRMVPVKQVFQKTQRLVRDVAHKLDKDVELTLAGEETEIDRTVVEELADPLIHLVRNAVDHGIERPEERAAAGKSPTGHIRLEAYHAAGHIVIELADDGRGIEPRALLQKARSRGLIEPDAQLTEQQIYQLIFLPGFSTAERVTDLSGRGVGLDVVKKNIESLRGRVEVHSRPGRGTTFVLKLPLTLAIIDGMVVEVGPEQYIVPVANIVQSVRPERGHVETVQGRGEYVRVRDMLVPLVRLHALYAVAPRTSDPWEALVVVVSTEDGRQAALLVDDLLGQQQVVVKSLGATFQRVQGISGASIMGDGRVALILDVPTLLQHARAA